MIFPGHGCVKCLLKVDLCFCWDHQPVLTSLQETNCVVIAAGTGPLCVKISLI